MKKIFSILAYTIVISAFTCMAQEKLPDWFLNPPVSPDHSCVYSIGISDPGLSKVEALEQAEMRAIYPLGQLVNNPVNIDKSKPSWDWSDQFYSGQLTKILKTNLKTLNSCYSNNNECIVLLSYSFMQHNNATKTDSIMLKYVADNYVSEENDFIANYETMVKLVIPKTDITEMYYINKLDGKSDSIYSTFERNFRFNPDELTTIKKKYPNAEFSDSFPNTAYIHFEFKSINQKLNYANQKPKALDATIQSGYLKSYKIPKPLNNGLWYAYIKAFGEACNKLLPVYDEKNLPDVVVGTLIIPASIGINNNNLEVDFRATNFGADFFTITYPDK